MPKVQMSLDQNWYWQIRYVKKQGAVVAHWFGSSGGSLVATPVLGSNPAISSAYSGLPVLRWTAIWNGTSL
jgi:hypothetical protein